MEFMIGNFGAYTTRSTLVLLALAALPMVSNGQKNKKVSMDPEREKLEQLQRDVDGAVISRDLDQAITLLKESLRIQNVATVSAQLGQLQLQKGDTLGYCISQRYADKGRDTDASALYTSICEMRDSLAFEASGLSSSRYPDIIAVTRNHHFADGRTHYKLYDAEGRSSLSFSADASDTLYSVSSHMPQFPGGESEMYKFMGKTIRYPGAALDRGISGVCYIGFVIEKDGRISEPRIVRGLHHSIDEESLRVISAMPRWEPGQYAGEPVEFMHILPVRYTLR